MMSKYFYSRSERKWLGRQFRKFAKKAEAARWKAAMAPEGPRRAVESGYAASLEFRAAQMLGAAHRLKTDTGSAPVGKWRTLWGNSTGMNFSQTTEAT